MPVQEFLRQIAHLRPRSNIIGAVSRALGATPKDFQEKGERGFAVTLFQHHIASLCVCVFLCEGLRLCSHVLANFCHLLNANVSGKRVRGVPQEYCAVLV